MGIAFELEKLLPSNKTQQITEAIVFLLGFPLKVFINTRQFSVFLNGFRQNALSKIAVLKKLDPKYLLVIGPWAKHFNSLRS